VERIVNTLPGRIVLAAIVCQLLLAPLFFWGILRIVEHSETELFVNDVRAYSRFLGDLLEVELRRADKQELVDLLDSVVLSHETVYAELRGPDLHIESSLVDGSNVEYQEDFDFGRHQDQTYFISLPLNRVGGDDVMLRLGFDETAIRASLQGTRNTLLWAIFGYTAVLLVMAVVVGVLLTAPLRALRRDSRAIASGRFDLRFNTDTNLTEVRDLATDLENMRDKLVTEIEQRVAAETARANLESKLRHVQKLEMVGTMAGGIAHEFNNLLLPIIMYTELVIDDLPADSSLRNDLQRILVASNRAKSLVQKILTFARQAPPERYGTIDVVRIVADALTLAKDLFPSTITFAEQLPSEAVNIVGDETQLHQVVMNLLTNAGRAIGTANGWITVEVATRTLGIHEIPRNTNLAPGDYGVISVTDTGHGMDAVMIDKIFQPFYTTRAPGEGTGLGLSVAHGIAAAHGGDIAVESTVGKGSTFTLFVPLAGDVTIEQAALGLHDVLYVAAPEASNERRVAAAAMGARTRTVASRAELLQLLAIEENVRCLMLDVSKGEFWASVRPADLPQRRATDACVLVLGELSPQWATALQAWPRARHLPEPVNAATIAAAVQRMLAQWPEDLEDGPDDSRTGDRRRTRRM
jgi:signal transduction histidine kinase